MSWKLKKQLKARLDAEDGAVVKDWGGKVSVALVYPNTYRVGMGNLAVHAIYHMLNCRGDIACERAFLPSKQEIEEHRRTETPILSLESQRPLAEFDVVAFSISFENDLLGILPILDLARIPHRTDARGGDAPLLIAGGAMPTLNPRPISKMFDAIALGEAEGFAGDLFALLAERMQKADKLAAMAGMPGVFVPATQPSPDKIERRWVRDLDAWPTQTVIHSADAEFGDMHLIEVQRGCPYRCRFCATPPLYHPPRHRGFDAVMSMVDNGLKHRKRFGLIGAHILSHPDFVAIAKGIHGRGATFSPSSVRADDVDEELAGLLAESGHRSVALGVEAGSERLRDAIGKGLSDDRILDAVAILARAGIGRMRLYFMIGLPGESDEDIEAIAKLSIRIRDSMIAHAPKVARTTAVDLTIAPFVPKPGTPFANGIFAGEEELKRKITELRRLLGRARGIKIRFDPPHVAAIEAFLSRGDASAIEFLEEAHRSGSTRARLLTFAKRSAD